MQLMGEYCMLAGDINKCGFFYLHIEIFLGLNDVRQTSPIRIFQQLPFHAIWEAHIAIHHVPLCTYFHRIGGDTYMFSQKGHGRGGDLLEVEPRRKLRHPQGIRGCWSTLSDHSRLYGIQMVRTDIDVQIVGYGPVPFYVLVSVGFPFFCWIFWLSIQLSC